MKPNNKTSINPEYEIKPNGDSAITIVFQNEISEALSQYIISLGEHLQKDSNLKNTIIETIPSYQSLTVLFHLEKNFNQRATKEIDTILKNFSPNQLSSGQLPSGQLSSGQLIEIPVCYDLQFGTDLETVANQNNISIKEVVQIHSSTEYLVHNLGFSPGFLYMGGLSPKLHTPRKKVPELKVPAGSVGIGGTQTGVYPQETPGGWQIIGRTPIKLFQPDNENPFLIRPLDKIKFCPITPEKFSQLSGENL